MTNGAPGEHQGIATTVPEQLGRAQQLTEDTAQRLIKLVESSQPVRRLRSSQLASALVGAIGIALFIGGVEEGAKELPILEHPLAMIAAGILLLLLAGALLERLAKVHE
ncbi:MAG TPA: hypothetical protein VH951_08505 [Dehalococcoidia bacterium]